MKDDENIILSFCLHGYQCNLFFILLIARNSLDGGSQFSDPASILLTRRPTSEPQERNACPPCLPVRQVSDFSRVSPILVHVPLGRNSNSELKFSPMEARIERRNIAALSPEFLQLPSCPGPFMVNTQVSIKRVFC